MNFHYKIVEMLLAASVATVFAVLPSLATDRSRTEVEQSEVIKEIKNFREERDDFFKNHQRSPLKWGDKLKFHRLSYYPIDLKYRFIGKIERYTLDIRDPQYYATFMTNKGTKKRYVRYGQFKFILNGKEYRLQIYKSILSDTLFIPFKDKTNGKETYSGGRYLDAEIMLPGYETVIDFNMAYNPSCAYNEKFTCVIPPEENILNIEIQAGEKKFR
ncbi:MAG: DUF1684 domain-containing protein [Thermodesulfobacteriota bacterium]|nr:DUF1684 domain-containing protein [Thermodesulfobacteriota bacterium]